MIEDNRCVLFMCMRAGNMPLGQREERILILGVEICLKIGYDVLYIVFWYKEIIHMAENTELKQEKNTDVNSENRTEADLQLRREIRRKRRKRNQALAYLTLFIFVCLLIGGIVGGIYYLSAQEQAQEESNASVSEDIEQMMGTEETLVKPTEAPETIPEKTPEEKLDEIIDAAIDVMPLEDKVAGLFIVTPEAITGVDTAIQAGDGTKDALNQYAVGGLVYFKKNIRSAEQLTEMLTNTAAYSRYPIFLAVDEEGGSVSRVAEAGLAENVGSAQDIGSGADPALAYAAGQNVATYLGTYGFNLDFAPVADIYNVENSIIGNRAYGSDSAIVTSMAVSMLQGLEDNGVSACLKHFPGIGSSTEDTHTGMAVSNRTLDEFRAAEFVVFKNGIDAGVDFIMISHLSVPAITGDNTPATLSSVVVTDLLRTELGYDGVIITDAMNMEAVSTYYGADEAAILALKAGCDMILMPDDFELAYQGVLAAVQNGTISEERINDSLRRIYRIKYADKLEIAE